MISSVDDMLETVSIIRNGEGETGGADVDPSLKGAKGKRCVAAGDGARKGSLANAHSGKRGTSPNTGFDTVVPSRVIVGKNPAGQRARERYSKSMEFAGKARAG